MISKIKENKKQKREYICVWMCLLKSYAKDVWETDENLNDYWKPSAVTLEIKYVTFVHIRLDVNDMIKRHWFSFIFWPNLYCNGQLKLLKLKLK